MIIFFISFCIAVLTVLLLAPPFIRRMHEQGLLGKDMNKFTKPPVAELGGVVVFLGFSAGIFISILLATYLQLITIDLMVVLGGFCTIAIITFIGVIDDIIGWKKGIRQWQHFIIPIIAAIPLICVYAGHTTMVIPILGEINFLIFYPLIIIPLAVTGASNAINMLAGFNGLEAGQGIILTATLTVIAFMSGSIVAVVFGIAMIGALLAFLKFNWFPAKIFGGDSLTLMIGANLAVMSVVGGIEIYGLLITAVFFIEFIIKAKHRLKSECFGIPNEDGTLSANPKGGSLTQWVMKAGNNKFTESKVTFILLGIQIIVCAVVFLFFLFK